MSGIVVKCIFCSWNFVFVFLPILKILKTWLNEHQVDRNERTYALKLALAEAPFVACLACLKDPLFHLSVSLSVLYLSLFVRFYLSPIFSLSLFCNLTVCVSVYRLYLYHLSQFVLLLRNSLLFESRLNFSTLCFKTWFFVSFPP